MDVIFLLLCTKANFEKKSSIIPPLLGIFLLVTMTQTILLMGSVIFYNNKIITLRAVRILRKHFSECLCTTPYPLILLLFLFLLFFFFFEVEGETDDIHKNYNTENINNITNNNDNNNNIDLNSNLNSYSITTDINKTKFTKFTCQQSTKLFR